MLAIVAVAVAGLHLSVSGATIAAKIRAACRQLGIDNTDLTIPAALKACNEAIGVEQSGPLLSQMDVLAEQLGLSFDQPQAAMPPPPAQHDAAISTEVAAGEARRDSRGRGSLPLCEVMSAPAMVHTFSTAEVPEELVAQAMACQFWAPNHKLKGSWRLLQLGPASRLAAARLLSAGQSPGKAEARFQALKHIPGCMVVVCKAFYETDGRIDKEVLRANTAVHNLALGLTSQGLGVKWVTGASTENYELWELIGLEPNEEVVVGLLWYGWPEIGGMKPVRDHASVQSKLARLP